MYVCVGLCRINIRIAYSGGCVLYTVHPNSRLFGATETRRRAHVTEWDIKQQLPRFTEAVTQLYERTAHWLRCFVRSVRGRIWTTDRRPAVVLLLSTLWLLAIYPGWLWGVANPWVPYLRWLMGRTLGNTLAKRWAIIANSIALRETEWVRRRGQTGNE